MHSGLQVLFDRVKKKNVRSFVNCCATGWTLLIILRIKLKIIRVFNVYQASAEDFVDVILIDALSQTKIWW